MARGPAAAAAATAAATSARLLKLQQINFKATSARAGTATWRMDPPPRLDDTLCAAFE